MRVLLCGVVNRKGVAKASGKAYDMTQVLALTPVVEKSSQTMDISGVGFECNELDGVQGLVALAKSYNLDFSRGPIHVDLQVTQIIEFGKMKTVIQGFTPVQRATALDVNTGELKKVA
ncbi:hypothetical protein [Silvimonas soli]|uniref:hypothetical protein n=1 Tax=Silvimonas soli TaxID=2980100 RepID=UPI0024B37819|nr:hypothetical protein [Silvimonas soli]